MSAQPVSGVAMTTGFALNPLYDMVALAFFFADALILTRPVLTTTILLFNKLSIYFFKPFVEHMFVFIKHMKRRFENGTASIKSIIMYARLMKSS